MNVPLYVLVATFLMTLGFGLGSISAQGNELNSARLKLHYEAGVFSFQLQDLPVVLEDLWVLQISEDMHDWQDLEIFEGKEVITVPIQRGARQRYYRARQIKGGDPYLSDYIDACTVWQGSGVDSYSMEIRYWSSWFFWHGNVTVRNDAVVSADLIDTNFFEPFEPEHRTINDWLEVLKRNIDNKAYLIDVTYDKIFGYPKTAFIDFELWIADEEQGWSILKFLPMR